MTTHLASCPKIPTSVGRLAESLGDGGPLDVNPTVVSQLKAKITPRVTRDERQVLDQAFADAMHKTGTAFDLFSRPAWREFFGMLSPSGLPHTSRDIVLSSRGKLSTRDGGNAYTAAQRSRSDDRRGRRYQRAVEECV